uniref:Orf109a n=1 Tax=Batis maritima TaxID=4436 RepID=A0A068BF45_BATMA|nr:orf109a [Batis maritima]AIC83329.1 orf109a [Batis maritima]
MHPVPLYLSISGHLKPYGSLTLGYRERFSRSATSYLSLLNLLTARSRRLIFSHQRIGRQWWDVWHYLIHGSGSQGHGRYCRRFSSDLFLVVIYRFRNCGLILNWGGLQV